MLKIFYNFAPGCHVYLLQKRLEKIHYIRNICKGNMGRYVDCAQGKTVKFEVRLINLFSS